MGYERNREEYDERARLWTMKFASVPSLHDALTPPHPASGELESGLDFSYWDKNYEEYGFVDLKPRQRIDEIRACSAKRLVLVSIPGGEAYAQLKEHFASWDADAFFQTVWLPGAAHTTLSRETGTIDHPFDTYNCPHIDKSKPCWQCTYITNINKLLVEGRQLAIVTSNVCYEKWIKD